MQVDQAQVLFPQPFQKIKCANLEVKGSCGDIVRLTQQAVRQRSPTRVSGIIKMDSLFRVTYAQAKAYRIAGGESGCESNSAQDPVTQCVS